MITPWLNDPKYSKYDIEIHAHKYNAAYHRINKFGNIRGKFSFSVAVDKRQAKEK